MTAIPERCVNCSIRIHPHGRPVPGCEPHYGRGLCAGCYQRKQVRGRLLDFPSQCLSRDLLMEEWEVLRRQGYSKRQAAERLRVTFQAFDRAFWRARKAGDPRARSLGERQVAS